MVSLVVRYLFVAGPNATVGASVRVIVPLSASDANVSGYLTGFGSIAVAGVEFGFGRSGAR